MTHATRKLISLKISPWSERAKWALDHHRIAYDVVEHIPVIGERRLRSIVGPNKRRATVPVLLAGDEVLSDSWDIALYADRAGTGTKLLPSAHEAEIKKWTALADDAMQAGRAFVLAAMLASPRALDEGAPPLLPKWLRPLLRPITRRATLTFARKYRLDLRDTEPQMRVVRAALDALRGALLQHRPFILGSFSYADIVMATLIQGISPVSARFLRLGPATRAAWTRAPLAAEYADLVAWRDELYESRRLA